jgi:hypothetical protein
VVWICVETDTERDRLNADSGLLSEFKNELGRLGYPKPALNAIHIGAESKESVDRESGGNWWMHWK